MSNYIVVEKKHTCPLWEQPVLIEGKYRLLESNPYSAVFVSCSCPILDNMTLPEHKQKKEYAFFRFCNISNKCLSSINFKPEIDIRKDGYSQ